MTDNLSRLSITKPAAVKILSDMHLPPTIIDEGVQQSTDVQIIPGKGKLRVVAKFTETDPVDAMNVVGLLPGTDPNLKNEVVGIGAHLDHLGKRGEVVYP